MAASLDVTYGYISQLRSGSRRTESISQAFADACAAYLGIPAALVKVLAGRVTMSDFLWPQRDPDEELRECLDALRHDAAVGCFMPPELYDADPAVQRFVWLLYTESADRHPTATRALPKALDYLQKASLWKAGYEEKLASLREAMGQPSQQSSEKD